MSKTISYLKYTIKEVILAPLFKMLEVIWKAVDEHTLTLYSTIFRKPAIVTFPSENSVVSITIWTSNQLIQKWLTRDTDYTHSTLI